MAGSLLDERRIVPEMLDHAPPDVARASLRDLERINRYLGGYYVLGRLFGCVVKPADSFSVLDIGAASGDMGAAIRRRYPGAARPGWRLAPARSSEQTRGGN